MTPDEIAALKREVERRRKGLEEAFTVAREIGDERNELAAQLGTEVTRSQELKRLLKMARVWVYEGTDDAAEIDAVLGGGG